MLLIPVRRSECTVRLDLSFLLKKKDRSSSSYCTFYIGIFFIQEDSLENKTAIYKEGRVQ